MKKTIQKLYIFAGLLLSAILLLILFSSSGAPIRERFRPKNVSDQTVLPKVEFAYIEDSHTMVVYFSDRPRLDYKNYPKKEYEKLVYSTDQSAYYFQHVHEKNKH